MTRFTLEIKLGNEAMQSPEHVAGALERIATGLQYGGWTSEDWADTNGGIRDDNGNTVGHWVAS